MKLEDRLANSYSSTRSRCITSRLEGSRVRARDRPPNFPPASLWLRLASCSNSWGGRGSAHGLARKRKELASGWRHRDTPRRTETRRNPSGNPSAPRCALTWLMAVDIGCWASPGANWVTDRTVHLTCNVIYVYIYIYIIYIYIYIHIQIYIYIYIYGHPPPPRAYLCPLLVEGVNSTLCASFLQMPENTVKYSVVVVVLPSM